MQEVGEPGGGNRRLSVAPFSRRRNHRPYYTRMNTMFDEFVLDAVSGGKTDFDYETKQDAIALLTRFNLEIDSIVNQFGTEKTGKAIWYCYGCISGMIYDVLDESNSNKWLDFYESMMTLYDDGFARHCENKYNHRLRQTSFGTACYMLWDMDGIEYLTFDRTEQQRQLVEPLIDFGLGHDHAAVQESMLHCLGHEIDFHPEFVHPKLSLFLRRRNLCPEIRDYALQCQTGMIL